ncbi:hypothetical protein Hdeb2414_s0024g00655161 [Helianthus debilis subsp. tardiflorus]
MLEAAMEKMKEDHGLQMKHKDDLIREISQKGGKRVVTKGNLRPKETETARVRGLCRRLSERKKKRSFWVLTTANSPSVVTLNGRKTRNHVVKELAAAPSMLL